MGKKKIIIFTIIIIIVLLIIGGLMFTSMGEEIRSYISYKILVPKENIQIENKDSIKISYTYRWSNEGFDIQVTDKEIINSIMENISNKKLNNYSGQIGLAIMGEYKVDLGNNISFEFDRYSEEYIIIKTPNKNFLTKINPEILKKVIEIVDEKLKQNIEMFKTNKITISKKSEDYIGKMEIEEKTAIEYILELCKDVYTKEINYEPNIVAPSYKIQFTNNVKLLVYNKKSEGWLLKDGKLSEAYGLNVFETIIENAFDNIEERKTMFKTDRITLRSPEKTVEVTDENIVEKITTNLMYSTIGEPKWLEEYDIKEEYDSGIKVQLNDYEFLIPGDKKIGNRYIISKDKKVKLCYPLQNVEQYIYEQLGIKKEKTTGPISIAIPSDIPKVTSEQENILNVN